MQWSKNESGIVPVEMEYSVMTIIQILILAVAE